MRKILKPFLSLALLTLLIPSIGQAETINQYEPGFTPDFVKEALEEGDEFYIDSNILSDVMYAVQPVRLPGAKEGDITLRISNVGAVSGCVDVTPPAIETKRMGKIMKIELTEGRVVPDEKDRQYSLHGCKVKSASSSVDVTLDRDQMIKDKIRRVTIASKIMGTFMDLKLTIDKEKALFIMGISDNLQSVTKEMLNGNNKWIIWFYPENTVVLHNPSIEINDQSAEKIVKLARSKGLTPLTEIYPDFRTSIDNRHKMYFIDTDGVHSDKLIAPDDTFTLGKIEFNKIYHGPEGPHNKPVAKPIYIKRPSLYE